ncbi:N-acetylmuramic acid 6-phosphate etherase [Belliella sp. R4-6]|uniref:N-acetylmuramic acid 6-phosphate etherase n=1 Tax=Belliella alkalica TaxID=1730871 RepID=A0ABS9VAI5_9BACT|nr:N-acetylmuramic acid 6-phosphate etherase [Belliella alkalica]MCH7413085.1 N-acetylmuramic acid 6-phosphate etherase [Belliella alkalica]
MTITESASNYTNLEKMSTAEILININREDQLVALAVEKVIPDIEKLVEMMVPRFNNGGRLFYIGAGTSGRLGILDASEIPPTYGASPELVTGLIAGGDSAIRNAVEGAEDDADQAWIDLSAFDLTTNDTVVGIAASGRTPYVIGGVRAAKESGILTACITCNPSSKLADSVDIPIVAEVGPEFVTGSTRMKSGTAQKLILNMISTTLMVRLGKVKGNKMINMQLSNEKLINRGIRMILEEVPSLNEEKAKEMLKKYGSVKAVIENS